MSRDPEQPQRRGSGRRPSARERWRAFRGSPFFSAAVLVLIIGLAAGTFAGSYTYAMGNPAPHSLATAVAAAEPGTRAAARQQAFIDGLEQALGTTLDLHRYRTYEEAREAVDDQRVFAVLRTADGGRVLDVEVAGASGASVAEVLAKAAPEVGRKIGVPVEVRDVKPLQPGDPRGLVLFYISLAAVIVGFVGAIQLSVHARDLNPGERIATTAAYALLGGLAITVTVDSLLNAVDLPFAESWLILALTMFTSGMVFTMFNAVIGRWAMLPTWGLMVIIGNPSSGGAVSWPLLPSLLGHIGRWLPPGASVGAQHSAVYFSGHQNVMPYLVLSGWAVLSCTVFWIWRHRHPGGRPRAGDGTG
ncbi:MULTISPECIES: hypothetical protein [Streptomyces]|uniref:ABC transporter permease n=1 Tax=Streptomyces lycii TaxID=2654337 RepID=A0ABQ7F8F2_9ACTN|nr:MULTISPECIES: hypothetical protein [Streptomyces]KAF4405159.1 ABC transporter permease [Streptomyces lycii]PGH49226.1 hypothetical protein CRI70_18865 [Streptomyces sp. Ru87]